MQVGLKSNVNMSVYPVLFLLLLCVLYVHNDHQSVERADEKFR